MFKDVIYGATLVSMNVEVMSDKGKGIWSVLGPLNIFKPVCGICNQL